MPSNALTVCQKRKMEQRTEQWHKERAVRITASRFGDVLARPDTKRYRYYMQDIIESLQGFPKIEKYTPWFEHGIEMEDEARGMYEWEKDVDVEKVGLIIHPKYPFISCSPDGKVGEGGLEIKSRKSYKQHQESERVGLPSVNKPQVQGCLWITKWKWWDFVSYYRNCETRLIHIYRVYPDLKYHKRLEQACLKFWWEIQERL